MSPRDVRSGDKMSIDAIERTRLRIGVRSVASLQDRCTRGRVVAVRRSQVWHARARPGPAVKRGRLPFQDLDIERLHAFLDIDRDVVAGGVRRNRVQARLLDYLLALGRVSLPRLHLLLVGRAWVGWCGSSRPGHAR